MKNGDLKPWEGEYMNNSDLKPWEGGEYEEWRPETVGGGRI